MRRFKSKTVKTGESHPVRNERGPARRARNADGFTLIELLIVVTIIPLIIGALAAGLITVFSLQSSVSNRLGESGDAQVVAARFTKDVQSATDVSTNALPLCGPASETQMAGLEFGVGSEYVSYDEQPQSDGTYYLVRNECDSGESATPTSTTTLSFDFLPPCSVAPLAACQPAPTASWAVTATEHGDPTTGAVSTIGMTDLNFTITEPNSSAPNSPYTYALSATPAEGNSTLQDSLGQLTGGSSCEYAIDGTGSIAENLCFVGFDTTRDIEPAYPNANNTCTQTDPGQQGVNMSVDVPNGDVMTFCLTVVPGAGENQNGNPPPVAAVPTPVGGGTCGGGCDYDKSNGQGFLGNLNQQTGGAFYVGIGCPGGTPVTQGTLVTSSCIDPAIFQTTDGGTDTITLSNILVTDSEGQVASDYTIFTMDAETVDPGTGANGSYIQWSSSLPVGNPLKFNLLSSSDLGNACNEVPAADQDAPLGNADPSVGWGLDDGDTVIQNGLAGGLSSLPSAVVKCQSNWQTTSPYLRTGTAILGISPQVVNGVTEPATISVQLKGEGYNAVAFGLELS